MGGRLRRMEGEGVRMMEPGCGGNERGLAFPHLGSAVALS